MILGEDLLPTENRARSRIKRILAIALPVVGRQIRTIRVRGRADRLRTPGWREGLVPASLAVAGVLELSDADCGKG